MWFLLLLPPYDYISQLQIKLLFLKTKNFLNTFFEHEKLFDLLRVGVFEHNVVLFRHLENENKILTARHTEVLFVCNGCFLMRFR